MIINHVREFRMASGLSQKQLATLVNVSRQTIISIELGRYQPSLTLSFKLSRVFGKTIEEVFEYHTK